MTAPVTVTAADRELFIFLLGFDAVDEERKFHRILRGDFDGWEKMQRIARHRQQAEAASKAREDALVEALRYYADAYCEGYGECVGDLCGKCSDDECGGCKAFSVLAARATASSDAGAA